MINKDIYISFDVDWAPDYILNDLLDLIYGKISGCTFFSTHNSEIFYKLPNSYEVALHPNFNCLLDGKGKASFQEIIEDLIAIYPRSLGYRSHSLTNNTNIQQYFKSKGFIYESNRLSDAPSRHYYDALEDISHIYIDFTDGQFIKHFASPASTFISKLLHAIESYDSVTLMFHPIHVFLNSCNYSNYLNVKNDMNDYKNVQKNRNSNCTMGVRKVLEEIITYIQSCKINTQSHSFLAQKLASKQ